MSASTSATTSGMPPGTNPSASRRSGGPPVSAEVERVDRVPLGLQHLGDARVPARMLGGAMHHDDRGPRIPGRQPPSTEDLNTIGALEGELVHALLLALSHDSEMSRSYPRREPLHAVDHGTASHRLETVERVLRSGKFGVHDRGSRHRLQRLGEVTRVLDQQHRVPRTVHDEERRCVGRRRGRAATPAPSGRGRCRPSISRSCLLKYFDRSRPRVGALAVTVEPVVVAVHGDGGNDRRVGVFETRLEGRIVHREGGERAQVRSG